MEFQGYQHLRFDRDGRILTVTIDRPDKLNAVSRLLHTELARVFHEVAADPGSDVIVLTGAGRAFCAGGDLEFLEEAQRDPVSFYEVLREARTIVMTLLDCDKPVICRMNGDAIGLGASIALLCDIIIAVDHARIADPHVRAGLVAGDGGALIWPQLVGYARAKQFLLGAEFLGAKEAQQMGLVNFAVPEAELDRLTAEWATRLSKGAVHAIRWTKATINVGLKQVAGAVMDTGIAYEGMSVRTQDHAEAVAALREKRRPVFTGR
jgi:enoyl-CoA hydratase